MLASWFERRALRDEVHAFKGECLGCIGFRFRGLGFRV